MLLLLLLLLLMLLMLLGSSGLNERMCMRVCIAAAAGGMGVTGDANDESLNMRGESVGGGSRALSMWAAAAAAAAADDDDNDNDA